MKNKKIRAVLVDDEPLALEGLRLRLAQFSNVEIIDECGNGEDAIQIVEEKAPDLLFLDLEMPGLNGFEVVQAIQSDTMPLVVFVTAYEQYAVDAFNMHAIDYILKPVDIERLKKAVDKAAQHLQMDQISEEKEKLLKALSKVSGMSENALENWLDNNNDEFPQAYRDVLAVKNPGKSTKMLPTKDIEWIDAAGDYMCIHSKGDTHIMRVTLKKLEALLDPNVFIRIHKSTIVNVDYIDEIITHTNGESHLRLSNNKLLKTSRNYKTAVQKYVKSRL